MASLSDALRQYVDDFTGSLNPELRPYFDWRNTNAAQTEQTFRDMASGNVTPESIEQLFDLVTPMAGVTKALRSADKLADAATTLNKLPMDEASRLARAKDMGFDTDTVWYHGTNRDFDEFDLDYLGEAQGLADRGFSFTNDLEEAKRYGDNVGEYYLNNKNALIEDTGEFDPVETFDSAGDTLYDWAERRGNDVILMKNDAGKMQSIHMNPANIRSIKAKFDPDKIDSADLLSSVLRTGKNYA